MTPELSNFAARLRDRFFVGDDVRSLHSNGRKNGPPHVGSYQDFNTLALELFALQFKYNVAYQTICHARGVTPETVKNWMQIPAVPTTTFKDLELSCIPPEERTAVFHSSGTTGQKPGRHFHNADSLALYETSLWSWFEPNLSGNSKFKIQNSKLVVLSPSPSQAPHSSLVHMFETVRSRACKSADQSFLGGVAPDGSWVLNFGAVATALKSTIDNRRSSILLGTAFSFVHLLDFFSEHNLRFQLPAGSRVMETGGYKNRSRTMPKGELHALITERLGIQPENIICEYGMSELSSQAYDGVTSGEWRETESPIARHFHFPPWARAQIISPETGREVAEGETGLIRVFDLANVFSVMAIQTEDLAVRRGGGFELIGRAQFVEPRGCSLMMDEPLAPALSPLGGERVAKGRVRGTTT